MGLKLIIPPVAEPVSLDEVKAHLRLETMDDDGLLVIYIAAARAWIDGKDGWLGRCLMTQTWELSLDTFPRSEVRLPLAPVQSIASVKYDDADGTEQTIVAGDYYLDNTSDPSWLLPLADVAWPTPLSGTNTVRVQFVAGYPSAAEVPAPIRVAILLLTGHFFNNREAVSSSQFRSGSSDQPLPFGVDALLAPYRLFF